MKKILLILLLILLSGCVNDQKEIITISFPYYFNTVSSVRLIVDKNSLNANDKKTIEEDLSNILKDLEDMFDANNSSTLSTINSNPDTFIEVNEEFLSVLQYGISLSEESSKITKTFDISIGVMWKKWGFVNNILHTIDEVPTLEEMEQLIPLVDYNNITIENNSVKIKPGMNLDLGSIVKGYACDKMKQYLLEHNIERAIIDVGGNILLVGSYYDEDNNDTDYTVRLRNPFYEQTNIDYYGTIQVSDSSIVTSGIYEKYVVDSLNNTYHHLLNPLTGYPFDNEVISVTVICNNSMKADGYSTMLFGLGYQQGITYVSTLDGIEVIYLIEEDNNYYVYTSNGIDVQINENTNIIDKGVYYESISN